jgi:thiol-disulfide isomerase/thioredoxin
MKRVIILFCFIAAILCAQVKKENYVVSALQKGDVSEGFVKFKDKYYANVNGGEFWKEIIIRAQDSVSDVDGYRIYLYNKSGYSVVGLSFKKIGENLYSAVENFKSKDGDEISALQIILDAGKKSIKYRWDNNDNCEIPKIVKAYPFKKGAQFPEISVETLKGTWRSGGKNKIIVINWWATDCPHCIAEMPALNKMVKKYKGKEVEFLSIVSNNNNLGKFLKKHRFDYLQGYGNKKLAEMFGRAFPRNIIISRDGVILYNEVGTDESILKELDRIIESNL